MSDLKQTIDELGYLKDKFREFVHGDENTSVSTDSGNHPSFAKLAKDTSIKGDKGDQGIQGSPGEASTVAGPQGLKGEQGEAGEQGIQGLKGEDSVVAGAQGLKGDAGVQGIQGLKGEDSDIAGAKGDQGVQGIQGEQGVQGSKGAAFTVDAVGVLLDRDSYDTEAEGFSFVDAAAGNIYFKLVSGWSPPSPFGKGDKGEQGIQGEQGVSGADSIVAGSQGIQGEQGNAGADSVVAGPQGLKGDKGDQGESGTPGSAASVTKLSVESVLMGEILSHQHAIAGVTGLQVELDAKLASSAIVDNLISTSPTVPLSANQGSVLKVLYDSLSALLTSDDTTLDQLQEIVAFIKLNRADLDALSVSNITDLSAALDLKLGKSNPVITGALTEQVYTLTGLVLNPANGTVQAKALSGSVTFTDSLSDGQFLQLRVSGGDSAVVAYPAVTWFSATGNTAPTLTSNDLLFFWKEGVTLYGKYLGSGS